MFVSALRLGDGMMLQRLVENCTKFQNSSAAGMETTYLLLCFLRWTVHSRDNELSMMCKRTFCEDIVWLLYGIKCWVENTVLYFRNKDHYKFTVGTDGIMFSYSTALLKSHSELTVPHLLDTWWASTCSGKSTSNEAIASIGLGPRLQRPTFARPTTKSTASSWSSTGYSFS